MIFSYLHALGLVGFKRRNLNTLLLLRLRLGLGTGIPLFIASIFNAWCCFVVPIQEDLPLQLRDYAAYVGVLIPMD